MSFTHVLSEMSTIEVHSTEVFWWGLDVSFDAQNSFSQTVPKRIAALSAFSTTQMSCGDNLYSIVSSENDLYLWGPGHTHSGSPLLCKSDVDMVVSGFDDIAYTIGGQMYRENMTEMASIAAELASNTKQEICDATIHIKEPICKVVRSTTDMVEVFDEAATRIQAATRGCLVRNHKPSSNIHTKHVAAAEIQRFVRGNSARRLVQRQRALQRQQSAAHMIQTWCRVCLARRQVQVRTTQEKLDSNSLPTAPASVETAAGRQRRRAGRRHVAAFTFQQVNGRSDGGAAKSIVDQLREMCATTENWSLNRELISKQIIADHQRGGMGSQQSDAKRTFQNTPEYLQNTAAVAEDRVKGFATVSAESDVDNRNRQDLEEEDGNIWSTQDSSVCPSLWGNTSSVNTVVHGIQKAEASDHSCPSSMDLHGVPRIHSLFDYTPCLRKTRKPVRQYRVLQTARCLTSSTRRASATPTDTQKQRHIPIPAPLSHRPLSASTLRSQKRRKNCSIHEKQRNFKVSGVYSLLPYHIDDP